MVKQMRLFCLLAVLALILNVPASGRTAVTTPAMSTSGRAPGTADWPLQRPGAPLPNASLTGGV